MSADNEDQTQIAKLLTRREMMDCMKAGFKELMTEQVTAFGWWSLRTLTMAAIGAGFLAWLYLNGWVHK